MAINPGSVIGSGGNPLWEQINQAQAKYQQHKALMRTQAMLSKFKNSGTMGNAVEDYAYDDSGHIQFDGKPLSVSDHYKNISSNPKEMQAAFGKYATPEMVKDFIKGKTKERDAKIEQSIMQRAELMGVDLSKKGNIYKVVPKKGEAGSDEFREWYKVASTETKQKLRDAGYHPELEDSPWLTYGMEKRKAQGKSALPGGIAALPLYGAGAGAAVYGANTASKWAGNKITDMEQRSAKSAYRKAIKSEIMPKWDKAQAKNIKFVEKTVKTMEGKQKSLRTDLKKLQNIKAKSGTMEVAEKRKRVKELQKQIKAQQKAINRRKSKIVKMRKSAFYTPKDKDLKNKMKYPDKEKTRQKASKIRARVRAEDAKSWKTRGWQGAKKMGKWGIQSSLLSNVAGDIAEAAGGGETAQGLAETAVGIGGPTGVRAASKLIAKAPWLKNSPHWSGKVIYGLAAGYSLLDALDSSD